MTSKGIPILQFEVQKGNVPRLELGDIVAAAASQVDGETGRTRMPRLSCYLGRAPATALQRAGVVAGAGGTSLADEPSR